MPHEGLPWIQEDCHGYRKVLDGNTQATSPLLASLRHSDGGKIRECTTTMASSSVGCNVPLLVNGSGATVRLQMRVLTTRSISVYVILWHSISSLACRVTDTQSHFAFFRHDVHHDHVTTKMPLCVCELCVCVFARSFWSLPLL